MFVEQQDKDCIVLVVVVFFIKYCVGVDDCFVFIVMEIWICRMDILFIWENSNFLYKIQGFLEQFFKIDIF